MLYEMMASQSADARYSTRKGQCRDYSCMALAQGRVRVVNSSCAQLESGRVPFTPVTTISAFTTPECVREGVVFQIVTFPCSLLLALQLFANRPNFAMLRPF